MPHVVGSQTGPAPWGSDGEIRVRVAEYANGIAIGMHKVSGTTDATTYATATCYMHIHVIDLRR